MHYVMDLFRPTCLPVGMEWGFAPGDVHALPLRDFVFVACRAGPMPLADAGRLAVELGARGTVVQFGPLRLRVPLAEVA